MIERGLRTKMNPVDDYAGVNVFEFCSDLFGEMRHSTEEEKQLYEDMLDKLSTDATLFEREYLAEWVYKPTCKDCVNFIGGGDWNLCCTVKRDYCWLCYEDTDACEEFVWKKH